MQFRVAAGTLLAAVVFLLIGGCATTDQNAAAGPVAVPELRPGILTGYLTQDAYPNSLALVPPPPAQGSQAQLLDQAINQRMLTLKDSARFELASLDNDLSFPNAAGTFSCAVGIPISEALTPFLYQLLRRTLADAGLATYAAKNHYERKRPFLINGQPNCASEREQAMLSGDPSYPSGHTSIGWAWALMLTTLVPERADQILQRGVAYGESRAVCNVHWPSDIVAGRTIGAAAFAALQSNPQYQNDLARARDEVERVRKLRIAPSRDCAAESAAASAGIGILIE